MNILFPIGSIYPSQDGGPSNTVYWLARALYESEINVRVVSTDKGIKTSKIVRNTWIESDFGWVMYTREVHHLFPIRVIIKSLRALRESDIVHLTSVFYPGSWVIGMIALITGKRIVWSPRGELDDKALVYSRWKKKPILFLLRRMAGGRLYFHATSEMEVKYILGQIKCDVHQVLMIPNYFYLPTQIERDNRERYLLFIGRIHPKKGLENLIEALELTSEFRERDYKLKIAGSGAVDYLNYLKQKVRNKSLERHVEFVGHIEGQEKESLLANAYWTIVPSHTENFGIVVIESLAQGTPVTASIGTPWDSLERVKAGFWINNTPVEISCAIDKSLQLDTKEYLEMRANSRTLAESYDITKSIGKWISVYESLK